MVRLICVVPSHQVRYNHGSGELLMTIDCLEDAYEQLALVVLQAVGVVGVLGVVCVPPVP